MGHFHCRLDWHHLQIDRNTKNMKCTTFMYQYIYTHRCGVCIPGCLNAVPTICFSVIVSTDGNIPDCFAVHFHIVRVFIQESV